MPRRADSFESFFDRVDQAYAIVVARQQALEDRMTPAELAAAFDGMLIPEPDKEDDAP